MATVFELLEREWVRLAHDRRKASALGDVCAVAGGAASLGEVEAYVRGAVPEAADRVLLVLVGRAVRGDDLAARVLVQLLLPGTRALARRWWALGDRDERAAAAVGAVYDRIRTYPLARRPGRVAANILMDAAQQLRRAVRPARLRLVPDPAVLVGSGGGWAQGGDLDAATELTEVLHEAVADGMIEAPDAELIARSRIAGERVADLAADRGLTARTLWDRRRRAEHRLTGYAATAS